MNCSRRENTTEHKFKSIFFQDRGLMVEKQGDLMAKHFVKKMKEK